MSEFLHEVARHLPAARAGSREALGKALEACRAYLLRLANRRLSPELRTKGGASDVVQETFLIAQRDFARFQGASEAELLAWLRCLTVRSLANFARHYRGTGKRQIGREVGLGNDADSATQPQVAAPDPTPSAAVVAREEARAVEAAMSRLTEPERRVISLRNAEQSFEEIGKQMGCSPYAARRLWHRAFERLQQELADLK
jgi:RNA polymerase sigma-70 factor (ECF subfamily)